MKALLYPFQYHILKSGAFISSQGQLAPPHLVRIGRLLCGSRRRGGDTERVRVSGRRRLLFLCCVCSEQHTGDVNMYEGKRILSVKIHIHNKEGHLVGAARCRFSKWGGEIIFEVYFLLSRGAWVVRDVSRDFGENSGRAQKKEKKESRPGPLSPTKLIRGTPETVATLPLS